VVIDIVHQLLNFLLIPHLTDETTPSSPVSNPQLILHKSDNQHKDYSRLDTSEFPKPQ